MEGSNKNNENISVPENLVYLGAIGLSLNAISGALAVGGFLDTEINLNRLDFDKPVEVKSLDRKYITLEQEGMVVRLHIDKLPDVAQKRLTEHFPHLKDFLENGPINIVGVEKK